VSSLDEHLTIQLNGKLIKLPFRVWPAALGTSYGVVIQDQRWFQAATVNLLHPAAFSLQVMDSPQHTVAKLITPGRPLPA
jgi:hypothetical protein